MVVGMEAQDMNLRATKYPEGGGLGDVEDLELEMIECSNLCSNNIVRQLAVVVTLSDF